MEIKSKKDVGQFIKHRLEKLNMKQIDLAEKLSFELDNKNYTKNELRDTVSKWVTGKRYPGVEYLFYIAKILDVGIAELLMSGESCKKYDDRPYSLYAVSKTNDLSIIDKIMNTKTESGNTIGTNWDEYDNNLLDYILEFENLNALKYMIEKGYVQIPEYGTNCLTLNNIILLSNNKFDKLMDLIIEKDNLELFKLIIPFDKNVYIIDDNINCSIKREQINQGIILKVEHFEKILKTKKIYKYLTQFLQIDQKRWEKLNYGNLYVEFSKNGKCINDKLCKIERVNTSFNILLEVAIRNNEEKIINELINQGIQNNNKIREELEKCYDKSQYQILNNGNVYLKNYYSLSSITIIPIISSKVIDLIKNKELKEKAKQLINEEEN